MCYKGTLNLNLCGILMLCSNNIQVWVKINEDLLLVVNVIILTVQWVHKDQLVFN